MGLFCETTKHLVAIKAILVYSWILYGLDSLCNDTKYLLILSFPLRESIFNTLLLLGIQFEDIYYIPKFLIFKNIFINTFKKYLKNN